MTVLISTLLSPTLAQALLLIVWGSTHIGALALVELLLMSILQHFLHHTTAAPHVKHRLPVLIAHVLQTQRI